MTMKKELKKAFKKIAALEKRIATLEGAQAPVKIDRDAPLPREELRTLVDKDPIGAVAIENHRHWERNKDKIEETIKILGDERGGLRVMMAMKSTPNLDQMTAQEFADHILKLEADKKAAAKRDPKI